MNYKRELELLFNENLLMPKIYNFTDVRELVKLAKDEGRKEGAKEAVGKTKQFSDKVFNNLGELLGGELND